MAVPDREITTPSEDHSGHTLDLPGLAKVRRGEQVRVRPIADVVDDLYEKTVHMLPVEDRRREIRHQAGQNGEPGQPAHRDRRRPSRVVPPLGCEFSHEFVPDNDELRERFLLAEAVGGYESLHDLLNAYSPGLNLVRKYAAKVKDSALSEREVKALEEYQAQIRLALQKANHYLAANSLDQFSREEIHELHDLLTMAANRDKELTRVLGAHLIHEVERAVYQLNELTMKIHSVEQSISGIFFVESEVMFIPTTELIRIVDTIFKAVGNPYLSNQVDGVMLLAARNLLIQVVAFFSYYGKHQIYSLYQKTGSSNAIAAVSFRIRAEIRKLFEACMRDNKLVLTRVMEDRAREFDLSVEAIQQEAEESAIYAVERIFPREAPKPAQVRRTWFKRVVGWFK